MKKGLRIRGFTLIEMLVVLSIIGVLLGISLPAFSRLMAGQGVAGGARQVGGMLRMTQAYAIGNNKYAALIIPGNQTSISSIPDSFKFHSFRPCIVRYDSSSDTCTFLSWVPNTKWEQVPERTLVFYEGGTLSVNDTTTVKTVDNGKIIKSVDFSELVSGATSVDIESSMAVVFKPDGSCFGFSDIKTMLGPGIYTNGTSTRTNVNDKITISINPYTGRLSYAY